MTLRHPLELEHQKFVFSYYRVEESISNRDKISRDKNIEPDQSTSGP